MKITIEMPPVRKCSVDTCAYNVSQNCHAKAITVGDEETPGCDTFFDGQGHNRETRRIAGVGACKVGICKFNDDFECTAEGVTVGYATPQVKCLTFSRR